MVGGWKLEVGYSRGGQGLEVSILVYRMKHLITFFIFYIVATSCYSQKFLSEPGLDKFTGTWEYINGKDTLTMIILTRHHGNDSFQIRLLFAYYQLKFGNTIPYNNISNLPDNSYADFVGSAPFGNFLDSIHFFGTDNLKRKSENGILSINAQYDKLKYHRDIEIGGGGWSFYETNQERLPGYTLPSDFIMRRLYPPLINFFIFNMRK